METRTCKDCGKELPITDFYAFTDRYGTFRHGYYCKPCHRSRNSRRHAEKLRREDDFSYLAKRTLSSAKKRAKEKGFECDLTVEWIEEKLKAGVCEVTGLEFDVSGDERRERSRNPRMPSLDRIDSSKGYTKDNVQVVIWIYNQAKGEWRHDEFMMLVKALAKPLFKEAIESGRLKLAD